MRRVLHSAVPVVVLSVLGWTAGTAAQQATPAPRQAPRTAAPAGKTATGVVSAKAADSLTITADGGKEWKFTVDAKTQVTGRATGARSPAAAAAAKSVMDLGLGDMVTVTYDESGGAMHARAVRVTAKYEDRF